MGSNRLKLLLVSMMAVFAISAVASASASAECLRVAVAHTGHWETNTCATVGTTKEYVEVEKLETKLKAGEWCAKVKPGEPSTYKDNKCTEEKAGTGEYTKVLESAAEQQQFVEKNGKEVVKKGFTSKEGISTLTVAGKKVECKADTDKGELTSKESVTKVVVTFTGCEIEVIINKLPVKCAISSKGIANAKKEIVTVSLKGELGEVAPAEATTEVGLLLEPESGTEFVTLNATGEPCNTIETKVTGQVAGEVTPLALAVKHNVVFALNTEGKQKIKKFERSFAKHCTGGVNCVEDGEVKPKLTAFGLEATFVSTDENTFEESVEVLKGL